MCKLCELYGEGMVWYKNPKNYSREMYKRRARDYVSKMSAGGAQDTESDVTDAIKSYVNACIYKPEGYEETKKNADSFIWEYSAGQVIPLQEAEAIVEIASPLAIMMCICRLQNRGIEEQNPDQYSCLAIGVGAFKWERWPERYRGGVEFVSAQQAKEWLRKWNKRGFMHLTMGYGKGLLGGPYIGGICNCDYPTCLAIRMRRDYGMLSFLLKSHYVAKVDYEQCTGCKDCLSRCHYGALSFEVVTRKANIDMSQCFGCGLCETGCDYGAIKLVERASLPALANAW